VSEHAKKKTTVLVTELRSKRMRKLRWEILGLSLLACGTGAAFAEGDVEFEVTADYFSKYIWRGQDITDDPETKINQV
jgi:hypothetical protein